MRKSAQTGHDFGLVKIGITWGDVARRVAKLQTGNPFDLVCFDSVETAWPGQVEHRMHRTHADAMQQPEWIRCTHEDLAALVHEAKNAARQIEEQKALEHTFLMQASNGRTRRATSEERDIHYGCRKVFKHLVPARLRRDAAECRLKAATGLSFGIPGIVSVKYVNATHRFNRATASLRFPKLAAECSVERMSRDFRWRNVWRPSHFPEERLTAYEQLAASEAATIDALSQNNGPVGWTARTPELERWHLEFLESTKAVHRLSADLAELQTKLVVRLGEDEALESVCSFRRQPSPLIDRRLFFERYPHEASECSDPVEPTLRKFVYTSRSYL
jgi:hypothetical protein